MSEPSPLRPLKLAVLGILAIAMGWAFVTGALERFEADALRARLQSWGIWAPVAFLLIFWLVQPFALSAHALTIGATLIWPAWAAFVLGWAGAIGSGITSFVFARFVARDWVQARLPERLRKYDEALARNGFRTVLLLRLFFFTTHPVQMMLGASRVRFWPFLSGTALGFIPGVLLDVVVGVSIVAWLANALFG